MTPPEMQPEAPWFRGSCHQIMTMTVRRVMERKEEMTTRRKTQKRQRRKRKKKGGSWRGEESMIRRSVRKTLREKVGREGDCPEVQ